VNKKAEQEGRNGKGEVGKEMGGEKKRKKLESEGEDLEL